MEMLQERKAGFLKEKKEEGMKMHDTGKKGQRRGERIGQKAKPELFMLVKEADPGIKGRSRNGKE